MLLLLLGGLFLLLDLLGLLFRCLLGLLLSLLLLRLLLRGLCGLLLDLRSGGLAVIVIIVAAAHQGQAGRTDPGAGADIQQ